MEPDDRQGLARSLAVAAWLFTLTSVWMPWWSVRYSDSNANVYDDIAVRLWRPMSEVTTVWGPWLTGMVVAILAIWLFVRIAAKSWHHEPPVWRRDLWLLAGLAGAALVSALFWPDPTNFTSFWGGITYSNETTGTWFTERVLPGLGWWSMVVTFLCLVGAAVQSRMAIDASDK